MKKGRLFTALAILCVVFCVIAGLSSRGYAAQTPAQIYALDDWAMEFISIPDSDPVSYQIELENAENPYYYVYEGESCQVSQTGLVTPKITTWYWYSTGSGYSYGTTYPEPDQECTKITHEVEYGKSTICAIVDGERFYFEVEVINYANVYAEKAIDDYVAQNFTNDMTTAQMLDAICRYPASFDYSPNYSGSTSMVVSGSGDCWASTSLILEVCERLGIEAKARNGNRDPGAGSGHMNVLVTMGEGDYYELDAGYAGSAPRYYSIFHRTSLLCYQTVSGGIEVYQYDGDLPEGSVLTIPETIDSKTVVSIGNKFISGADLKTVVIPDTVTRIGESAFNSCEYLQTLHIPASVTSIGVRAFTACVSLKNFTCSSENPSFTVENGVLYNKEKTRIISVPAAATVNIPSTVETIGAYAFYYNENLKQLELPKSVKTVEEGGISACHNLMLLILRDVQTLYGFAFAETGSGCQVFFGGDAPALDPTTFYRSTVTAYYPKNNATWTAELMDAVQEYGTVTWTPTEGILAITDQPAHTSAASGKVAKTTVTAIGEGMTYQWYTKDPGSSKFTKSSNTTATYACKMTGKNSGRQVYCVITDKYGNTVTSEPATLYTLEITSAPADGWAKLGKKVTASVEATGQGLTYQWYIKDPGSSKFTKSSVTTATYGYTMTEAKSGRQVYCVITDKFGTSVKTSTVVLRAAASVTKQPANASAAVGAVVKTSVKAFGTDLTYQWYVAAPGKTTFAKSSNTTATYSCKMSKANDGRRVYCVITDGAGNTVKSKTVTLYALQITSAPADGWAKLGKKVTATVGATGEGLTYQWYIKDPGSSKFTKSSVTAATYGYTMTEAKSGRQVYCVITDKFGTSVKTSTVVLRAAASVTKQPVNASAADGAVVKTSVKAFGTDLTYQWYVAAPGKTTFAKSSNTTATYSCKMSKANDGRRVYCVITDSYGNTVRTNTVTLTMK